MRMTRITVLLAVLIAIGAVSEVAAQGANVAFVYEVTPKMGSGLAFQSAIEDHFAFRRANGDTWTWQIYEVVIGENIGDFIIRSGSHTWADMDAYNAMTDFQQAVGAQLAATVTPHVTEWASRVSVTDTAMTTQPPNIADINVFGITEVTVDGEGQIASTQALAQYHTAAANAGMYHGVLRNTYGASGTGYTIVTYHENFAALEDPSPSLNQVMADAYGDDEALEIAQAYLSGIESQETSIIVLRRDLMGDGN